MRFDTHAYRIRYGVPIFVTFTPDEAHNSLMLRLSRTRRNDPVAGDGGDHIAQKLHSRLAPSMGTTPEDSIEVNIDSQLFAGKSISYEDRVAALAHDSMASVDGFHVIVRLTLKHLFGLQICPHCPDCNNSDNYKPCQDLFGNSSMSEGGIFGRIEASFISIDAQKSGGALHAHSQIFVQCLRQHTPLAVVLDNIKNTHGLPRATCGTNNTCHVKNTLTLT